MMKICNWLFIVGCIVVPFAPYCHSVNFRDPCDPARSATVTEVLPSLEIEILSYYNEHKLDWIQTKLKFVNCSKRGLKSVPSSIPNDVQLLDLSLNALVSFGGNAFSRFTKLVALSLAWNCPKNPSHNIFFCEQNSTFLHESAFTGVTQLKLLNLSNNILKTFPKGIPSSIQYLDISSTAVFSMSFDVASFLDNLVVVVAEYLCPDNVPDLCPSLHIKLKPNTFAASNHSLKLLNLAFNNFFRYSTSSFLYKNMIALNLAQTRVSISAFQFGNLKYLNLNFLFPDEDIHVWLSERTFDLLTKLEFLDLSNNMINIIPENMFEFNKKLIFLELSGNCLFRDAQNPTFLKDLRHLRFLYLGFNFCNSAPTKFEISEFNKPRSNIFLRLGSTFSTLTGLELLSFGLPHGGTNAIVVEGRGLIFNTINATSLLALKDLSNLHTLSLAYCKVRSFDIIALNGLTNVARFDISHNFIESFTIDRPASEIHCFDSQHLSNFSIASPGFKKSPSKLSLSMVGSVVDRYKTSRSKTQILFSECNMNYTFDLSANSLAKLHHSMFIPEFSTHNFTSWLDLSSNLIITIRKHSFSNWKKVCGINLKDNPLRYIKNNAFHEMNNLKYIIFNSTKLVDHTHKTLEFLSNVQSTFHLQMTNGHVFLHFKPNSERIRVLAHNAVSVDLSGNEIISKGHLEKAFLSFPNVTSIKLKSCRIPFINFVLSNKLVMYLDLSDNKLPDLPTKTLQIMPKLKFLFLSNNVIVFLRDNFAKLVSNLEELDLSHNRICQIKANVFEPAPKNLTKLWLNNNYLTQVSIQTFAKALLQNLLFFDLRWNAIGCDCSLTKAFGWWLSHSDFTLQNRPGFIPTCSQIFDYKIGGCAKCQLPKVGTDVSLLMYSCNKSCQEFLPKILLFTFLGCTLLLLLVGYATAAAGPKWKAWLSQYFLKDIIFSTAITLPTRTKTKRQVFAFHAFVCFDLHNQATSDWVDNCLVPNINSQCRVMINGKSDECGVPPATQLLLKLEASRKTLVILSGNYGLSQEFKYIASVLEYLEYKTGNDHLLLMTFQNDKQVGGLLDKQHFFKPWNVLNVPDEHKKWPMLWNYLNAVILGCN